MTSAEEAAKVAAELEQAAKRLVSLTAGWTQRPEMFLPRAAVEESVAILLDASVGLQPVPIKMLT